MGLISKYKKEILLALGIVVVYLASRLVLLGNFPIFTDEALYVRWTQIAAQDANWRFISLTDGKQPMLIWFGMVFIKLIDDPLVAVRLVSVVSGLFTIAGFWLLTRELFKDRRAAFLSSILYVAFPFAVVYDRLALYDSMVGAFSVWAIYFSVLLVRKIRLDIAFILGFVLAAGLLTKSSSIFSVYLLPGLLLLFNFKQKNWERKLIEVIALGLFAALMSLFMYNLLRLSPFFHIIAEKNTIFVYPIHEWIKHPLLQLQGNIIGLTHWVFTYLTPFYLFLIIVALFTNTKFIREKLVLLGYFLLPFLALAVFGSVIFPRFIFFMTLYLLPLAAMGLLAIINLVNRFMIARKLNVSYAISPLIVLLFILYPAKVSLDFIFDPKSSAIVDADRNQYITQWPAGGGVAESVKFFKEQAAERKIFIGTEGSFGLMPYALEIYLADNPNVKLKGYWPVGQEIPEEVLKASLEMPTYFIFYQPCIECEYPGDPPDSWPLKLVSRFKKGDFAYYSVYKVEK